MAQNSRKLPKPPPSKNRRDLRIAESLNRVDHPHRQSLIIGGVWVVIGIILSIVIAETTHQGYALSFFTAFAVVAAIASLWALGRVGLGEKGRLKYHNARNKRMISRLDASLQLQPCDYELTPTTYRAYLKQHSYWGIIALLGACALVLLVTGIVVW